MFPYWRLQNVCDQDYDPVFSLTEGVVLYEVTINVVFVTEQDCESVFLTDKLELLWTEK